MNTREKGAHGERLASEYLERNGVKIIGRNYFTKFGEIDLIGIENETIIFIEVKLRQTESFGAPYEALVYRKLERMQKCAELYLLDKNLNNTACRFDAVLLFSSGNNLTLKIEWLKNLYFA